MTQLILKRASASRPSGEWNDEDFDVLADGAVVGRIMKVHAAPVDRLGSGRLPSGIMRIARRRTATPRRARPRWRRQKLAARVTALLPGPARSRPRTIDNAALTGLDSPFGTVGVGGMQVQACRRLQARYSRRSVVAWIGMACRACGELANGARHRLSRHLQSNPETARASRSREVVLRLHVSQMQSALRRV
jgi:hypothetical protein